MKNKKNLFLLAFTALFASFSLASCGESFFEETSSDDIGGYDDPSESLDPNKTTVYIGNYYGGLGDAWLKDLCKQYEATHPDVQFKVDNDKTKFLLDNISTNIKSSRDAIFFIEKIYYYDMVSQGMLEDITDVVTAPLTAYGDTGTIENKLNKQYKDYLAYNEVCKNKYYALPTYLSHHGLVYDVDLFELKKLYIGKDSTNDNIVWVNGKTQGSKSAGMDGVMGTVDDGLPVTVTQFKSLVNRMYSNSVTPFIWTGQYNAYTKGLLNGFWADYEGADNFLMNYSLSGNASLYGESAPVSINSSNAYKLQKQSGKKFALDIARWIASDSRYYASSSTLETSSHLDAQDEFVASRPSQGTNNVKPIGMIIEGDWWENEAREEGSFTSMVNQHGSEYAYGTRRFSIMPFPKDDNHVNTTRTIVSTSSQNAFFINSKADPKVKEIAKDFLKFCHTTEALRLFTKYTGVMRPFTYDLTSNEYDQLTHFSKSIYDTYRSENVKIVYDLPLCDTRIKNAKYFQEYWNWQTSISGLLYNDPFIDFINDTEMTSLDYFNGMQTYHESGWSTQIKK